MAESAHLPNITSALIDLHKLLTIFQASESIAALAESQLLPPTRQIFDGIERDEITRILLGVAATVRIVEDRKMKGGRVYDLLVNAVGSLVADSDRPSNREKLELREACNKILHSRSIEALQRLGANNVPALDGRIRLRGKKDKRDWVAEIDAVDFCASAAFGLQMLTDRYEGAKLPD